MFGDLQFVDNEAQEERWGAWINTAMNVARNVHASNKRLRVVVLEIGCGDNVRTVRHLTESTAQDLASRGAQATLVRVNLDLPLPDTVPQGFRFIGVMSGGLEALQRIESELASMKERNLSVPESTAAADSAFAALGGAGGSASDQGSVGDLQWISDQTAENCWTPFRTAYRATDPKAEDRGAQWVAAQMLRMEPSLQTAERPSQPHALQQVDEPPALKALACEELSHTSGFEPPHKRHRREEEGMEGADGQHGHSAAD